MDEAAPRRTILVIATLVLASMGANTGAGVAPMWDGHMWDGGRLGWRLMWTVGLLWMVVLIAVPVRGDLLARRRANGRGDR